MKNNNHGSTFRMDAYTGEKKGPDTTFAYDAMIGGEKKEEEVTPIGVKGENPVSGTNAGANFRMDAYSGSKGERKMESTFDYGAMMGKGKKEEEAPAEPVISAKGENPVSGTNAGANFRMDAYAGGKKKEGPKVESTFAYDAIIGKKK